MAPTTSSAPSGADFAKNLVHAALPPAIGIETFVGAVPRLPSADLVRPSADVGEDAPDPRTTTGTGAGIVTGTGAGIITGTVAGIVTGTVAGTGTVTDTGTVTGAAGAAAVVARETVAALDTGCASSGT